MRLKNPALIAIAFLVVFIFLYLLCIVPSAEAGKDSLTAYYSESVTYPSRVTAQQPPFNYIANVSIASADWTPPAGVTVQLLLVKVGGSLKIATWTDTATLYPGNYDFIPVNTRRVFKTGTSADSIVACGKR